MLFKTNFFSHLRLLAIVMFFGLSIYILADLFEKLDTFVVAESSFLVIIQYFVFLLPSVFSTILPAVFFLATIILLCFMAKSKELTALNANGISNFILLKQFFVISLGWAFFLLLFSQFISSLSTQKAVEIYEYEKDKNNIQAEGHIEAINNVWFTDKGYVVNIETLYEDGRGVNIQAYRLQEASEDIINIIKAEELEIKDGIWTLYNVQINTPDAYVVEEYNNYVLPVERGHENLFVVHSDTNLQDLPIHQLNQAIDDLVTAGSNVEALKTVLQVKLAYAFSLISFTFFAFALLTWSENVYLCVASGMVVMFLFYVFTVIMQTLGENGSISPYVAAWLPHALMILASSMRLSLSNQTK